MNKKRPMTINKTKQQSSLMNKEQDKTVINTAPDYAAMASAGTSTAILNAVIKQLFGKKLTAKGIAFLIANVSALIFLKRILDDAGGALDKFSLSNLSVCKYGLQWLRHRQATWTFVMTDDVWKYEQDIIDFDRLKTTLLSLGADITGNGTSYVSNFGIIIKIVRSNNTLSFTTKEDDNMKKYMMELIIKHRKIVYGSGCSIYKLSFKGEYTPEVIPIKQAIALPVENYVKLSQSLKKRDLAQKVFGANEIPYTVNFNGPPGAGKTTFSHFAANEDLFDIIYIFNMTTNTHGASLSDICKRISDKVLPKDKALRILIIFDEIDKWIKNHINETVEKEKEESRKKTTAMQSNKKEGMPVVPEKMTQDDIDSFKQKITDQVTNHFHQLVDGHLIPSTLHSLTFIINTNNFDETFIPMVGVTYAATLDRIQKYEFPLIGKKQIVEYLTEIARKALTDTSEDPEIKEFTTKIIQDMKYLDSLDDQIRISYRELDRVMKASSYELNSAVKMINEIGHKRFLEDQANAKDRLADRIVVNSEADEIKSEEPLIDVNN